MIKGGCKDTEEIKEDSLWDLIDRKYTGFSGDSMWQILCQLKVSLSSDQYFNLNKTAQWGRTDGEQKHKAGKRRIK